MKVADNVVIRHNCDCASATVPPGEDGAEHLFTIDGQDFPWAISERGPVVIHTECYDLVSVEIVCSGRVDAEGVEVRTEQ